MKPDDLALSYFKLINGLENDRIEIYQKEKSVKEQEAKALSLNDRLNLARDADDLRGHKEIYEQRQNEKYEMGKDLLEELQDANIKPGEKVEYHLSGRTYFEVWYLENGEVYATLEGYTKL